VIERRDLRVGLCLALAAFVVYNANGRAIDAGDTYSTRYLPFAIWHYGSLRLDPIREIAAQGRAKTAYWIVPGRGGHAISLYPVVAPVLLAPLYLPAVRELDARGWDPLRVDRTARVMEKLAASLMAAITAALFYCLVRRRAERAGALLLAIAFAFGSTAWVVSSQALWQHGLAQLLLVAALLVVTGAATPGRVAAMGLLCGLVAGNRPPDTLLAAALGLYALRWAGRRWPLLLTAALPTGLVLAYNLSIAGNIVGGYGIPNRPGFFENNLLMGLAALLVSPT
jgi:hypothetical protein